jgi:RHS repeat-associated protein
VVVTYDSAAGAVSGYLDGQQLGAQAIAAISTTLTTASLGAGTGDPFGGSLDELSVYGSVLTSDRINSHWRVGSAARACPSAPTTGYAGAVSADSPLRYLRLGESSGRYATDFAPGCRYAAYPSGVGHVPGALVSDVDGGVRLPTSGSRTVELWADTTQGPTGGGIALFSYGGPGTSSMFDMHYYNDVHGGRLRLDLGQGALEFPLPYVTWDGNWHQVAVTYDTSTGNAAGYLDGAQLGVQAVTPALNTTATDAVLGADANANPFTGNLDELSIFGSALTPARILAHYNAGVAGGGPYTGSQTYGGGANFCQACAARWTRASKAQPVDTGSGNMWHSLTDLSIAGRGFPLTFSRTYNSAAAGTSGLLGYGWQGSLGMSLAQSGSTATVTQENGATATFQLAGGVWAPSAPRFIATLVHNGDGTWTFGRRATETYMFNSTGQLVSATDLNGYVTTYGYTSGQLTSLTEDSRSGGRSLTIAYTAGRISTLTDANVSPSRVVQYQYNDGNGNLTDVIDVNGGHQHYAYDTSHRLTLMQDPQCYATSCPGIQTHYDAQGRADWQKDELNRQTSFDYSSVLAGTKVTDPNGNVEVDYYTQGLEIAATRGYGTTQAATWSYAYDLATLARTATLDPNGNTTTAQYDSQGNPLTVTDALSRQTVMTYNTLNQVLTSQDGSGVVTTNTYDTHGNLLTTCVPVNPAPYTAGESCASPPSGATLRIVTYHYDDPTHPGDLTSVTDPDGKVWQYAYDTYGNRSQTLDPLSDKSTTTYNADNWVLTAVSPNGYVTGHLATDYTTTYGYADQRIGGGHVNAFGDVGVVTDPLGHTTTTTYDADRNVTYVKDGNGKTTQHVYDVANQPTDLVRPDGSLQQTVFDADGNVLLQIDGLTSHQAVTTCGSLPHCTGYAYDALNHLTTVTDPLGRATQYVYDGVGNLKTKTDPQSHITTSAYDAAYELTGVSYSDGVTPGVGPIHYDADGRRLDMADGTGTTTSKYDSAGRLTYQQNGAGQAVQYTYDLRGHVTSIVYPGSTGTVTRHFDDAGRMDWVQDWQSNKTQFAYDANGNMTGQTYPNGTAATYTPNAADQLMGVSDALGGNSPFLSLAYQRDQVGNLTSDTGTGYGYDTNNRLTSSGGKTYAYDNADQLTALTNGGAQSFDAGSELAGQTQPIGLVGKGAATNAGTGLSTTITFDSGFAAQANDQVLVGVTTASGNNVTVPGWTQVGTATSTGTLPTETWMFIKKAAGGETTATVQESGSVPFPLTTIAAVYRGVDPTTPVDGSSTGTTTANSTTVTAGSITTSVAGDELLLYQGAQGNATAGTWSAANMTQKKTADLTTLGDSAIARQGPVAAGATGSRPATFTQSASLASLLVALKPQITTYTYDQMGNRTTQVDAFGSTTTYHYDQANRMTSKAGGPIHGSLTFTYGYNGDGLRMSKAWTGSTQQVAWDTAEGLPLILYDGNIDYVYGPGGLAVEQVLPQQAITLAGKGKVTNPGTSTTSTLPFDSSFSAQANDQIVVGVTTAGGNNVSVSGYTQVGSTAVSTGTLPTQTAMFIKKAAGGETGVTITSPTPVALTAVATVYRGVDPNHSVDGSANGTTSANSTSVTTGSITTTVAGDELVLYQGAQGNATAGTWSVSGMTEEKTADQTLGDSAMADQGSLAANSMVSRQANFTQSASLAANMVALRPVPTTYYLHHDQVGSTRAVTDPSGVVVATLAYDAYGQFAAATGTVAVGLAYAGQYWDWEAGFYYLRARYYDPSTAQFISRDPMVATTRQPYAYTADNPLNHTDPSGLCDWNPFSSSSCEAQAVQTVIQPDNLKKISAAATIGSSIFGVAALGCEVATIGVATPVCAGLGAVALGLGVVATAADVGLALEGHGNGVDLGLDALGLATFGGGEYVGALVKAGRMSEVTCSAVKIAGDFYNAPATIYSTITSVQDLSGGH